MSNIAKTVAEDYGVKSILEYKSDWSVLIGFATGAPENGNTDWFCIKEIVFDAHIQDVVFDILAGAYSANEDICAHWFFYIKDADGEILSKIAELLVEKRVERMVSENKKK